MDSSCSRGISCWLLVVCALLALNMTTYTCWGQVRHAAASLAHAVQACTRPADQPGDHTLVQQQDELAGIVDSLAMELHVAQHNAEMAALQNAQAVAETIKAPVPGSEDAVMQPVASS